MPRWDSETTTAAESLGWCIVASDGNEDYQGWGAHLLWRTDDKAAMEVARDAELEGNVAAAEMLRTTIGGEWAVLAWSYGSCSGCDSYEGQFEGLDERTDREDFAELCASVFGDLIERCDSEAAARMKFSERKGW